MTRSQSRNSAMAMALKNIIHSWSLSVASSSFLSLSLYDCRSLCLCLSCPPRSARFGSMHTIHTKKKCFSQNLPKQAKINVAKSTNIVDRQSKRSMLQRCASANFFVGCRVALSFYFFSSSLLNTQLRNSHQQKKKQHRIFGVSLSDQ